MLHHKRLRASAPGAQHRRLVCGGGLMIEQKKRTTLVVLASSSSTPTPSSSNADRVLDATSPTSGLVDRYSSLLREFRRAKAELGGAAWLAQWRADHGGARPTLEDARRVGAPRALRSYVETRERLLAETPVLREEIGVAGLLLRRGGGGGASEGAGEGTGATTTATAAATATRSARAQAALTMGVAADYRKRRASEQAAVAKVERVVQAEGEATEGAAVSAQAPAAGSSRVRAAALAALAYKKKGGATVDTNDMPKPSAAVSVLASLLKESPPKPVADEAGEGQQQAAPAPVVAAFESAKGDVAAAMAATPRGRDKRRVGAAEGAGLAQVVL